MITSTEMSEYCGSILAPELLPGETPTDQGRASYLRELSSFLVVQGGYTFVLVTSERVLWTPFMAPGAQLDSLRFGDLASFSEGEYESRYALLLRHPPIERLQCVPRRRLLRRGWVAAEAPFHSTETIFGFSGRDTQVAAAIRHQLARWWIPAAAPLDLPPPPPPEPARYLVTGPHHPTTPRGRPAQP